MSDEIETKTEAAPKPSRRPLSLRRTEKGAVKQSFSHGRTKTVVVGNDSVIAKGGGWTTAGGGIIALETTYRVPDNAVVGTQLDSGAGTNIVLAGGNWNINPMGVCVTIRQPNPVEAGAGSLEDMGFGSLNSGSGQVFGSLTDPQGSMTNVISGVLGNVLGNMS